MERYRLEAVLLASCQAGSLYDVTSSTSLQMISRIGNMSQGEKTKSQKTSRIQFLVGLAMGLFLPALTLFGVTVNWWLGALLLLVSVGCICRAISLHGEVQGWRRVNRVVIALL